MAKIILLTDLSEEYGKSLLKGMTAYTKKHSPWAFCRMPLLYLNTYGIKGVLKWAQEWGADGIIAQLRTPEEADVIANAGIPLIVQDLEEKLTNTPAITGAYYETGKMAADYFLKNGYTHFAFYGSKNIVWSRERSKGFEDTLLQHGFNVYHFEHHKAHSQELWYYLPSSLSSWLLSLPKPIALMACDDNQGQHITEACKLAGIRIPEEVAVLGVDNDEMICHISDPPLSSISLDAEKGGYEAAELMDKLIHEKGSPGYDIVIKPVQIITRRSTDFYATSDPYVQLALKYIHQHIHQNPTVRDVLREVPLSRRALEKRFGKVTGYPLYKYIYHLRIEKFSQQLVETDKTINEIAIEMSFQDSKNLSRLFKEVKGCTPNDYRKKHIIP